ncbi:hypothetical protein [uncultured Bilophila sp.]|nr:hypothetical protein [uncultured Bilophila sp.]
MKMQLFFSFRLGGFMAEPFFWLFLWNFKEKGINHFLGRVVD